MKKQHNLPECGYSITYEFMAEAVYGARAEARSPCGYSYPCKALSERMRTMGLEVVLNNRGAPKTAACKICGPVHITKQCDPAKHAEYYDALERSN